MRFLDLHIIPGILLVAVVAIIPYPPNPYGKIVTLVVGIGWTVINALLTRHDQRATGAQIDSYAETAGRLIVNCIVVVGIVALLSGFKALLVG